MNNFNFNLIDTPKGLEPFTYSWNQDGTLSGIQYPNNTNLNITYHNKIQDNITLTKDGNTLFEANGGFDGYDRLTSEAIDITTPNGTISEDYSFSYDALSRLSSMNYSSDNRTITYGYDGSIGDRLTSVNFSDTGTYNITYDTKGRIDYVTYPNNQGTEEYTYDDTPNGKGRLTNITYPDGKSLSFSWNSRGKLTQLTAVEGGTNTTFSFSYDGMNKISGYNKTTTKVGMPPQTENWNFYYGITGIEKATRKQNGIQNLTIDYSTDTNGRILSAAYNETGGFNGELFYTFDSFGNTVALTNTQGNVIVGYLYDLNNGAIKSEYNPQGIDNPYKGRCINNSLSIGPWQNSENEIILPWTGVTTIDNEWGILNINTSITSMAEPPFIIGDCCPEVGLGTNRKYTGDEIEKAYNEGSNNGRSHLQGVLAVLKLLFGDDLSNLTDSQIGSLIDGLSKEDIDNLINSANEGDGVYVYLGSYKGGIVRDADTGEYFMECRGYMGCSEKQFDPGAILSRMRSGAGFEPGITFSTTFRLFLYTP